MPWYAILGLCVLYSGVGIGLSIAIEKEPGQFALWQHSIIITLWPLLVIAKVAYWVFKTS